MSLLGRLFGRNDDEMAESESLEWAVENQYSDLLIKRHQYEQMQEQQRRADRAEYDAEQAARATSNRQAEVERQARAKRANGQIVQLPNGDLLFPDGTVTTGSINGALDLRCL